MKDARTSTGARRLAAAVLVAATVAVMLPIAWHGTPIGHDTIHHLAWATEFTQSLAAGILYPRWLPDVNGGLGNPTFIFYGPALFYLAALVRRLAGGTARSLDLAAGASLLVSGIATYRYFRGGLSRTWALLGAVASLWLPYRLLDLYERGALAEFAAFAWPPLVLLALRRLASAPTWVSAGPAALGLAAATAGLALTHLPSLVLWGPIVAVAAVVTVGPGGRLATTTRAWTALALGLGLAALYLLPAYAERRFVQIEWLERLARAEDHTLFSTRIESEAATLFNVRVSKIACLEGALAAVAAAAALWPGPGRPWRESWSRLSASPSTCVPAEAAAAVAAVAFALMTPWSAPLWRAVPVLEAIQFPWRLLLVLTPAAALLVACAAARLAAAEAPRIARALGAATLVLLGANFLVSALRIVPSAHLDEPQAARFADDTTGRDVREYRPRAAPPEHIPSVPRAVSLAAGARVEVLAWMPTRRLVAVDALVAAPLRVGTFRYAGWAAVVDGRSVPLTTGPAGVIEVPVPAGRHLVQVSFGSTPDRRAGLVISAGSGLALLFWAAAGRRTRA